MALSEYDWRPITFQGVEFPATLMGAATLESVLGVDDEDFGSWLWRLTICRGVTKRAPAERCARCAQKAIDLMLEHRQHVLDGIRDCLGSHGFEPESTYRDWIAAFQRIIELSRASDGECVWSAPSHPNDTAKSLPEALAFLEKARAHFSDETQDG
jgi:hypothetical protein